MRNTVVSKYLLQMINADWIRANEAPASGEVALRAMLPSGSKQQTTSSLFTWLPTSLLCNNRIIHWVTLQTIRLYGLVQVHHPIAFYNCTLAMLVQNGNIKHTSQQPHHAQIPFLEKGVALLINMAIGHPRSDQCRNDTCRQDETRNYVNG